MAQTLTLPLLLLITTFSTTPPSTVAASPHPPPDPRALVSPITKDSITSLYTIYLNNHIPFLLDLSGTLLWSPCPSTHPTILCDTTTCAIANSTPYPHCHHLTKLRKIPSFNSSSPCRCTTSPVNPVTKTCGSADLTVTNLTLSSTNGQNPTAPMITLHDFISSCAPKNLLRSLPVGSTGVAGLSRSALSLPTQLSFSLSLKSQFAICLPSTGATQGVAFFGDKPFYLSPPTPFDVTTVLSYTPLLKNPMNSANYYYIKLCGIAVNGEPVPFLSRILEFDSLGHGGVQLSTTIPYTALRSHIYLPFLRAFAEATKGIPRAPRVRPFDLCLKSNALGFTRVGYAVPQIDLMLPGGKNWTVFGANSMKQVRKDVACLAFVNGGPKAEQAVVVGGFQMEDNFMLFDVGRSRLGFSSSLLFMRTTCGNFNFTSGV